MRVEKKSASREGVLVVKEGASREGVLVEKVC